MTFDSFSSMPSASRDPILNRLLERMPPAIAHSFTEEQLAAFQAAMSPPHRHKIDLRLSIPLLHKRFYLICLAGPERRSRSRRLRERTPLWTPANVMFLGLLLVSFLVTLFNLSYLMKAATPTVSAKEQHPTALPWIESEAQCRGVNRTWKDGFCFDSDHSPEF